MGPAGLRITFYSAAAAVAQSRYQLIEDPAGPWQDPVTGKHYRNTEDTGESVGGASGDGVSQVDVVAVEGNDVVLSMAMYGIDRATDTLAVLPIRQREGAGWRHRRAVDRAAAARPAPDRVRSVACSSCAVTTP